MKAVDFRSVFVSFSVCRQSAPTPTPTQTQKRRAHPSIHGDDDDDVHAVDPRCRRVIDASVSREDDAVSVSETKKISNCIPTADDDDDDAVRGEREG